MGFDRRDGGAFQISAGTSDVDGAVVRQLVFGVTDTDDEVGLEWPALADLTGTRPVRVSLRIGTMSARQAVLERGAIVATEPPHEPRFGPNAQGILHAVAEAFALLDPDAFALLRARLSRLLADDAPTILHGKVPEHAHGKVPEHAFGKVPEHLYGKVPKDLLDAAPGHATQVTLQLTGKVPKNFADGWSGADLAETVAQYAAAGAGLGALVAGGGADGDVDGDAPAQGGAALGALAGVLTYLAG
jgi:hypothetical protein